VHFVIDNFLTSIKIHFLRHGELNISVQHNSAFDFRRNVFSDLLQEPCPDDINETIRLWYEHASFNHKAFENKQKPRSLIFPFAQGGPKFQMLPSDWV
jgi:hypothetical protein